VTFVTWFLLFSQTQFTLAVEWKYNGFADCVEPTTARPQSPPGALLNRLRQALIFLWSLMTGLLIGQNNRRSEQKALPFISLKWLPNPLLCDYS
jgi:hypothetical protein